MNKFEDRLFTELMDEHGDELANARRSIPRRRVPRPVAIAAGTVALAGVATAGVVATSGHDNPAFAVEVGSNGNVSMTIREMKAVGALNAKLRLLEKLRKINVPVRVVRVRRGCTATYTPDPDLVVSARPSTRYAAVDGDGNPVRMVSADPGKGVSVVLRTRGLPAGQTIVVGLGAGLGPVMVPVKTRHGHPVALVAVSVGRVEGAAPHCLPLMWPHR